MPGSGETVTGLAAAALMSAVGPDACASPSELAEEAMPPQAHSATASVIASAADTTPLAHLIRISGAPV